MLIGKNRLMCVCICWGCLAKLLLLFSFPVIKICIQSLILRVALYMQCQIFPLVPPDLMEWMQKMKASCWPPEACETRMGGA